MRTEEDVALREARDTLMDGLGRISAFWGLGKMMGQMFGLLYLSPVPLTLDEVCEELSVSKGHVSTTMRGLERLGMAHRSWRRGDRKDYYQAETDLWKVVRGILQEREKREFDQALSSVSDSLRILGQQVPDSNPDKQFYLTRTRQLRDFFKTIDRVVDAALALDDFRAGTLARLGLRRRGGAETQGEGREHEGASSSL